MRQRLSFTFARSGFGGRDRPARSGGMGLSSLGESAEDAGGIGRGAFQDTSFEETVAKPFLAKPALRKVQENTRHSSEEGFPNLENRLLS